ncbi:MAG: dimethylsulfonioproprionate lyase family protein [Planctomycetes bacterium]|nr:dimethylsulfonioproprionate lyase family protein [Planctomycetota bacterium]
MAAERPVRSGDDAKSRYISCDALPWRDSPHAGVTWKKLHFDPATGDSAVLLKFAPGAAYGAHRHPAGEQYLILEGALEEGGKVYGPGTYVHHPPGSAHRPRSAEGCVVFVILPRPIEEIGATP